MINTVEEKYDWFIRNCHAEDLGIADYFSNSNLATERSDYTNAVDSLFNITEKLDDCHFKYIGKMTANWISR